MKRSGKRGHRDVEYGAHVLGSLPDFPVYVAGASALEEVKVRRDFSAASL